MTIAEFIEYLLIAVAAAAVTNGLVISIVVTTGKTRGVVFGGGALVVLGCVAIMPMPYSWIFAVSFSVFWTWLYTHMPERGEK